MDKEILCKTKWYQVGYLYRSFENISKVQESKKKIQDDKEQREEVNNSYTTFEFQRIYSPREIIIESEKLSSLGVIATLIECEPYNHDEKNCEFCEYKNCRGRVILFEYDKNF